MSADIAPLAAAASTPAPARNPFETARRKLVAALNAMTAPAAYPSFPSPDDHEGIAAHLREAAAIFDEWLAAVGHEVRANANTSISAGLFSGSFSGAIEGNETWACEEAAIEMRWNRATRRRA
jgi:hypothetical protein